MRIGSVASGGAASSGRDVDAQRTPTSMSDVRSALSRAIQTATGRPPTARTLDVLAAQVSLETAHGGAMYNFNFGGIKGASPKGDTAHYLTHEVLNGKDLKLEQGFRAYNSLDAGAKDYVSVLQSRFPQAFSQAMAGNIDGFAHALRQAHYYTASEQDYTSGLRAAAGLPAQSGHTPALASLDPSATNYSTSADLTRVLDAIAASASRIADPDPRT
jgi:hypothetical protein